MTSTPERMRRASVSIVGCSLVPALAPGVWVCEPPGSEADLKNGDVLSEREWQLFLAVLAGGMDPEAALAWVADVRAEGGVVFERALAREPAQGLAHPDEDTGQVVATRIALADLSITVTTEPRYSPAGRPPALRGWPRR
jgi:hypothetical protein